ncbi:MAG: PqqD family protein [Candidatus Omnitrophica bacterium]|nr:PqqD family protein [Candidatus Omnitrophota bacterium]
MPVEKQYPRHSREAASRIIEGEAVVVMPREGVVRVLNETGARIWQLSDGSRSLDEIARCLQGEFEVPLEQLNDDLRGFVREMAESGMMELRDEPGTG